MLEEGCCPGATPFCCGDGTCAASPADCASAGRNNCNAYDIPCGAGCAPAGSQCCDLAGHYCPPQGVCTSETACLVGDQPSGAALVLDTSPTEPADSAQRTLSPLTPPPDGTDRSCALQPQRQSAAPWSITALLALVCLRRKRRP